MKNRTRTLESIVDSRIFTEMLVLELVGAARRNETDPHLVIVKWNPNNWNISAVIKPDEQSKSSLSLTVADRWCMILDFDDGRLKSLTPDLAVKLQDEVAFSFLDLLKQIPKKDLEEETQQ